MLPVWKTGNSTGRGDEGLCEGNSKTQLILNQGGRLLQCKKNLAGPDIQLTWSKIKKHQ